MGFESCIGCSYRQPREIKQMKEWVLAKMDSIQEDIKANKEKIDSWWKEMKVCQEATETCRENAKPNPAETKAILEEIKMAVDNHRSREAESHTK
jgi:uncharacterized protein YoxC